MAAAGDRPSEPSKPAAKTPAPDLTGRSLGEFKLLRKLGKGGMAEVYLAEQTSLRRQVAVKVLRPEFTSDAGYLQRFQQEASAAGTLSHPNIVQVYLVGEHEGFHYIAQEYVQGRNLKEFIARKGILELSVTLVILRQVAAALSAAGNAGIVHRDIKPENILLTKRGEAKVADFGLAQLTLQGEKVALTQVGITMGTPLYMSPEQVNGKQLDTRSDLYSFGVMAYHMLAGKPPFKGDTPLAIAVQHLNSPPPPLKGVRPDLPDAVCDFVHKLIAKKRNERYPDAAAVAAEIKQLSKIAGAKDDDATEFLVSAPRKPATMNVPGPASIFDRPWKRQLFWLIPLCVLSAGSAAGAGWLMRVKNPFEKPAKASEVPKLGTPQAQYYHALSNPGDPKVWQAIIDNFSPRHENARIEVDRAELQLAMIDLREGRLPEAEKKFNDMYGDGESTRNTWKKAHAQAGLAIIASLQGRAEDSRRLLSTVKSLNQHLDAVVDDAIKEATGRNGGGR